MAPAEETLRDRLEALLREACDTRNTTWLRPLLERSLGDLATASGAGQDGDEDPAADDPAMRFGLIGSGPGMAKVFDLIERTAKSKVAVLVQGDTGTGKELVALALHHLSGRKKEFVAENCAAISPNLFESELFGHKRGSFTGAASDRDGHFVAADGGSLFLDEVGDMPLDMQAKLLRALESGEIRPVGSNTTRHVDVRIIAATNRDLAQAVETGRFRQDLYYRLAVVRIDLPPLRERREDIPLLARFFLSKLAAEMQTAPRELTDGALAALVAWDWPGNVRQLENEMRRVMALGTGAVEREDLSPALVVGLDTPAEE